MVDARSGSGAKRLRLTRRLFIGSAALVAGYTLAGKRIGSFLLQNPVAAAAPLKTSPLVDAHCHIFNIRDVPAAEFISNVLVREQLVPYGRSLANLAQDLTLWALDRIKGQSDPWRTAVDNKLIRLLTYIHLLFAQETPTIEDEIADLTAQLNSGGKMDYTLVSRADDQAKLQRILTELPKANGFDDIRQQIKSGFVSWLLNTLSADGEEQEATIPKGVDEQIKAHFIELVTSETENGRQRAAAQIAGLTYSQGGEDSMSCAYLRFLVSYTHSRAQILAEANDLFKAAQTKRPDSKIRVFTPATVDYEFWLRGLPRLPDTGSEGKALAISPLEKQAELYGLMAKLQPDDVWLHSFVAYDPLRHALALFGDYKKDNSICTPAQAAANEKAWEIKTTNPMVHINEAINHHGAVGVKVYPPMGFRAFGNADIDVDRGLKWKLDNQLRPVGPFGPLMPKKQEAFCREFPGQNSERLGVMLDRALTEFYRFCLEKDVAIMAHCSRTQGSFGLVSKEKRKESFSTGVHTGNDKVSYLPNAAADRADPIFWIELLESPVGPSGENYANLRLNLAHAGGPWCLGAIDGEHKGQFNGNLAHLKRVCSFDSNDWREGPTWFHKVATFLGRQGGAYPNVYFDISDWTDPVNEPEVAKLAAQELVRLLTRYPGLRYRMMYGTDWIVMATRPRYHDYFDKLYTLLTHTLEGSGKSKSEANEILADICGRNAVRFLGLTQGGNNRERLERFYAGKRDMTVFDELIS